MYLNGEVLYNYPYKIFFRPISYPGNVCLHKRVIDILFHLMWLGRYDLPDIMSSTTLL